jgi:hypothetical protein
MFASLLSASHGVRSWLANSSVISRGTIPADGGIRLLSRNGHERGRHFGPVFGELARLGRQIVIDGEIAAPDGRFGHCVR